MINIQHVNEAIWHTLFSYFFLLLFTRIMGRKQIAQLTFFDYVTGISIGSIAAVVAVDQSVDLDVGITSLSVWTASVMLTNYLTRASVPARKLIDSHPVTVIYDGKILEDSLGRMYYNVDDLLMQLRNQGVFDPAEVEFGVMEPDGRLSIMKKSQYSSVTKQDLSIPSASSKVSRFTGRQLIVDGVFEEKELKFIGVSKDWVWDQLNLRGITDITTI